MSMTLTRRQWGIGAVAAAAGGAALSACSAADDSSPDEPHSVGAAGTAKSPAGGVLERSIVLDLHCDTPGRIVEEQVDLSRRDTDGQLDIPRMREGGVTGVFFSIYTSATKGSPLEAVKKALAIIDAVVEEVNRHPDDLVLATTADEIIRAKQDQKIAILMGVEGGHMIDSSLEVLRSLYRLGARYMTLTHSAPTPWAGSSGSSKGPKGLTGFGKDVVREMNRLGMMVDISHVSDQTFFDALETSSAPIIASHSSCRALAGHPRNMTDEMLKALAAKGGVVHINYYNAFLDAENKQRENKLKDLEQKRAAVRKEFAGDSKQTAIGLRRSQHGADRAYRPGPLQPLARSFRTRGESGGRRSRRNGLGFRWRARSVAGRHGRYLEDPESCRRAGRARLHRFRHREDSRGEHSARDARG